MAIFFLHAAAPACAQQSKVDDTATPLDAITVTAPRSAERAIAPSMRLEQSALRDRQPALVPEALRGLPGVSIRPNSRGESVVRLRGSEERQVAVFLDGAPLTVPWDGRVDLGVLPAGLIQTVSVTKGAVPIEYGANAVAGVVDLETSRDGEGIDAELHAGTGNFGSLSVAGAWLSDFGQARQLHSTFAAAGVTRDWVPVADSSVLPFSQASGSARINTDLDVRSLFAATGESHEATSWRVSLLHADVERGIAPEAHLDPAIARPRYWRYPTWTLTQLNLAAETTVSDTVEIRGVFWRQWFAQTIDAYRTESFDELRARERDNDDTVGARITLTHGLRFLRLRWSATAQSSTHEQVDQAFPAEAGPLLRYRQDVRSVGVEADWPPAKDLRLSLGLGLDAADTPLTGDKPAQRAQQRAAFSAVLAWEVSRAWTATLSGGRRTRFPTARELYGEALGRFLINPDLQPETADMLDLDVSWQTDSARVSINPFFQHSRDTLSQRVVNVSGRALRQRFNLPGSTSYGVDAYGAATLARGLALEMGGTWLRTRVETSLEFSLRHLPQRPAHELFAALDWQLGNVLDLRGEVRRVGRAFDIAESGAAVPIDGGTELNLRASIPLCVSGRAVVKLELAVDNVNDRVIEPQLGLPLPGRAYRLGFRL